MSVLLQILLIALLFPNFFPNLIYVIFLLMLTIAILGGIVYSVEWGCKVIKDYWDEVIIGLFWKDLFVDFVWKKVIVGSCRGFNRFIRNLWKTDLWLLMYYI